MEVTVKTLDSKVHLFKDLNENLTVSEFKQKIEPTVGVPASTQRLIFQGKVLKDDRLLKDFGVAGKVIHLVERAPPASVRNPKAGGGSQQQSSSSEAQSRQEQQHSRAQHFHAHRHHQAGQQSGGRMTGFLDPLQLPSGMANMTQSIMQGLMASFAPRSQSHVTSSRSADGHSVIQIDVNRQGHSQQQGNSQASASQNSASQSEAQTQERSRQVSEPFVKAQKCLDNAIRGQQFMLPVTSDIIVRQARDCEQHFESPSRDGDSTPRCQNPDFHAVSQLVYNIMKLNRQMDPVLRQLAMCFRFPSRLEGLACIEADALSVVAQGYFRHLGEGFRLLGNCCLLPSSEAPGHTPGRFFTSMDFSSGAPLRRPAQEEATRHQSAETAVASQDNDRNDNEREGSDEPVIQVEIQGEAGGGQEQEQNQMETETTSPSPGGGGGGGGGVGVGGVSGNPSIEVRLNVVQQIPVQFAHHFLGGIPAPSPQQQEGRVREQGHGSSASGSSGGTGAGEGAAAAGDFSGIVQGVSLRMLQALLSSMSGNDDQAQMSLQQMFANVSAGLIEESDHSDTPMSHLVDCLMRNLTVAQSMDIIQGGTGPLSAIQPALVGFIETEFLGGNHLDEETSEIAFENIMKYLEEYVAELLVGMTPRRGISIQRTVMNALKKPMHQVVTIICAKHDEQNGFGIAIKTWFRRTMAHFVQILGHCLDGGRQSVESLLRRLILGRLAMPDSGIPAAFQDQFFNICLQQFVWTYVTEHPCNLGQLDAWVVKDEPELKRKGDKKREVPKKEKTDSTRKKVRLPEWISAVPDELPEVSQQEEWHFLLSDEWIPVVTRDVETQKKMPIQRPLSDAYLNYVPAKRKKTEVKTVSADQAACEVLCEAIDSSGLRKSSRTPIEEISRAAAGASQIGGVYKKELDHQLRRRVLSDPDFDPVAFPSAAAAYRSTEKNT